MRADAWTLHPPELIEGSYHVVADVRQRPSHLGGNERQGQQDQVEDRQENQVEQIEAPRLDPVNVWVVISMSSGEHFRV